MSGAARCRAGEAGRCRWTRPLERVVRPQATHAAKGNTTPTERRRRPKPLLPAGPEAYRSYCCWKAKTVPRAGDCDDARTSKCCRRQGASTGDEATAAGCKQKENARERQLLSCGLTDRELSGAARCRAGEAGRCRWTRPLERVVRPQATHAAKGNTTPTERRRRPKPLLPAGLEAYRRYCRWKAKTVPRAGDCDEARTSKCCRRQEATSGDEAVAAGSKQKENAGERQLFSCGLTDHELSGAAQCRTGEAGRCC